MDLVFKNKMYLSKYHLFIIDLVEVYRIRIVGIFIIDIHGYEESLSDEFSGINIIERLINKIREIIPLDFNFQIYKTSIFTVFRRELVLKMTIA